MKGKKIKFRTLAVKDLDSLIKPLLWAYLPANDYAVSFMGDITFTIQTHVAEWGNNDKYILRANDMKIATSNSALWLEEKANRLIKEFVQAALGVK